jgi:hypothetical protein
LFFFNPEGEGLSPLELLDTPKEQRNYIDTGCFMRIRVEVELFSDDEPGPPEASEGVAIVKERSKPPYSIQVGFTVCLILGGYCSMHEYGIAWAVEKLGTRPSLLWRRHSDCLCLDGKLRDVIGTDLRFLVGKQCSIVEQGLGKAEWWPGDDSETVEDRGEYLNGEDVEMAE